MLLFVCLQQNSSSDILLETGSFSARWSVYLCCCGLNISFYSSRSQQKSSVPLGSRSALNKTSMTCREKQLHALQDNSSGYNLCCLLVPSDPWSLISGLVGSVAGCQINWTELKCFKTSQWKHWTETEPKIQNAVLWDCDVSTTCVLYCRKWCRWMRSPLPVTAWWTQWAATCCWTSRARTPWWASLWRTLPSRGWSWPCLAAWRPVPWATACGCTVWMTRRTPFRWGRGALCLTHCRFPFVYSTTVNSWKSPAALWTCPGTWIFPELISQHNITVALISWMIFVCFYSSCFVWRSRNTFDGTLKEVLYDGSGGSIHSS